ncbi:MAG: 16S rRNA (uracil(1498)-N(3))-methyltransferase, partial [Chloroflexi bacterium]|nr:16S rRNA (uracil(1498)-N(3))-methyltransferase [Chloroflexota bacterium]
MTPRFFISPDSLRHERVTLDAVVAHQVRHVLRLQAGDTILLLDNSGWEFEVELEAVGHDAVSGRVVDRRLAGGEPRLRLTLYQALLKADKFEWVLQKGTELGIAVFRPVLAEHCVRGDVSEGRMERWRRIVQEAAEQSRRGRVPSLHEPVSFAQAAQEAGQSGLSLIAHEQERGQSLRAWLSAHKAAPSLALFVGPEGGFSAGEMALAAQHGLAAVSLGPRILRAETAGLVAASAIFYE